MFVFVLFVMSQWLHLEIGITNCAGLLRRLKRFGLYLALVLYKYECISKIQDCLIVNMKMLKLFTQRQGVMSQETHNLQQHRC